MHVTVTTNYMCVYFIFLFPPFWGIWSKNMHCHLSIIKMHTITLLYHSYHNGFIFKQDTYPPFTNSHVYFQFGKGAKYNFEIWLIFWCRYILFSISTKIYPLVLYYVSRLPLSGMFFLLHVCIFSLERVVRCNFEIILIDFWVTSCVHIVHQSPEALNGTVLYKHTPCVMHVSVGVCEC